MVAGEVMNDSSNENNLGSKRASERAYVRGVLVWSSWELICLPGSFGACVHAREIPSSMERRWHLGVSLMFTCVSVYIHPHLKESLHYTSSAWFTCSSVKWVVVVKELKN